MLDLETQLKLLERPKLLAQAARFGVDSYRRDSHLPRILGQMDLPRPAAAVMALLGKEAELEAHRKEKAGHYRPAHHVDVLIALLGEVRIMRAAQNRL
ncbi:DUF6477 family protein [Yoonia litorea]|uniref:Uncharacterized protein n=1 Tax=Yoonia litorea TaxID=1123755 RepID=A0A1I6M2V7_9RHOB|nr:DUF6477 family protein [Yoonia litorea]SFS09862.1 hypothetical protein SAMN05444714_1159 [Yoonia litorea]